MLDSFGLEGWMNECAGIGLHLQMPDDVSQDDLAYVFRIDVNGRLDLGQ